MNALDIVFVVMLVFGAGLGLARGFVRIVIGILSLVVAFVLASRYQDQIAAVMMQRHVSETPARVGAYCLVFIATLIAGGLVALIVGKILKLALLSWADRLAGGALGIVAALLAATFLVHPVVASSPNGSRVLADSKLAPYVCVVADLGNVIAPDAVAQRYDSGMAALRRIWRGEGTVAVEKVKKAVGEAVKKGEKAVETVKKTVATDPKKKP